ncbi:MAG: type II secretion system F family protein [Burkholderiales bacterium]|nr:type II secretion system F family protein [Burkholderiales bacterium]
MRFDVRAIGQDGVTSLSLEAATSGDAAQQVSQQGYTVLSVRRKGARLSWRKRFPLMLFNQELATLLRAGLGLVEALQALHDKHQGDDAREVLARVLQELYRGKPFSAALAEAAGVFPRLYVETIRAAERTGGIAEAIERFVAYQAQIEKVKNKLVSASIYPLLLVIVGSAVALFMLVYVVPRFSAIYADVGRELPLLSSLLLAFGRFVGNNGWMLVAAAIAAGSALYALSIQRSVREALLRALWRIPAIGSRMRAYQLARFYRATGMLLRGGVPFPRSVEMVSGLLSGVLATHLGQALAQVREGRSISDALHRHGLTTPIALRMLAVGERSGNMGEMMEKAAAFFDEELERWVDWFVRLFEPLLMIVIGLVIGIIVLLMYLPIFDLAGTLQ